jgi:large subunit ribosomal protein L29
MVLIRVKEINAMTTEAREQKLTELRAELTRIRTMVHAGGAVENPTRIRQLRRTIAQILTIQNEKKLGIREPDVVKKEKPVKKAAKKTAKETVSE